MKIRVYYWSAQRMGNIQIKVAKLNRVSDFINYMNMKLNKYGALYNSTQEPNRRWYCNEKHMEIMRNDPNIELKQGYVWSDNKRS